MSRSRFQAAGVALLLAVPLAAAPGRTFYIDSAAGNDGSDGLSEARPWKSLAKVNSQRFNPGDKLLLKSGAHFTGQMRPRGSGADGSPIVIDQYGSGPKPVIAAEGRFHEALLIENADYWEVNNLELTNLGPARETFRYGVRVRAWDFGVMRHIHLKNLYVHDVNGSLVKKDAGEGHGIVWENGGSKVRSRFDGLLIEGCRLERTDRNGICGYTPYRSPTRGNRSTHVVIRKNTLEDIGGDGIKVWGADGAVVEHNVLRGARTRCDDYAAGIWPWDSDDTVIQFNEVTGLKGTKDGEAFDSDAFTRNTVLQYNYSHDNDGGFLLVCCSNNVGTVVRYNISENDGARLFHMADGNQSIAIYNNVFYIGKGKDVALFLWTGRGTAWTRDVRVVNNIFYSEGIARNVTGQKKKAVDDGTFLAEPGFGGSKDIVFDRNVLYGNFHQIPEDWKKMMADPKFAAPGRGVEGYRLRPESPCIGAAVPIENNGGRDFFGTPVRSGKPSIGAIEPR
ncbi:MAG TPA: right-handed parallel beta-helix repeat-containing protein [Bryobacteraceae bacterium]|nr:right-handed parallel beta-helix repeat-containing protein [Bryobacteraceae bacterium]